MGFRTSALLVVFLLALICGCGGPSRPTSSTGTQGPTGEVVVYTALDREFSEPILQEFEKKHNVRVLPVYDTEATKTTGLVNRIIAEADQPRCDVFWNNEIIRTIALKKKGMLEAYASPAAKDIPLSFKDPEGTWAGFAARGRVFIFNKQKLQEKQAPRAIQDLAAFGSKAGIANPLFGTTSTQVACLFANDGAKWTQEVFDRFKVSEVAVCSGNASVRDDVVAGRLHVGLTDTDDANVALSQNSPIGIVYPDQDTRGLLLIPNTVSILKKCPHPDTARRLVDYLLSTEVEAKLAACPSAQIPVRPGIAGPAGLPSLQNIRMMSINFEKAADELEASTAYIQDRFIK